MTLLTEDQRRRVQHIAADFLANPKRSLRQCKPPACVPNTSSSTRTYNQPKADPSKPKTHNWSNADELVEVNHNLLENFIEALKESSKSAPNASSSRPAPKTYGVHIGRHHTPGLRIRPPNPPASNRISTTRENTALRIHGIHRCRLEYRTPGLDHRRRDDRTDQRLPSLGGVCCRASA